MPRSANLRGLVIVDFCVLPLYRNPDIMRTKLLEMFFIEAGSAEIEPNELGGHVATQASLNSSVQGKMSAEASRQSEVK